MAIRLLIADDHKLFRQGLISLMKTREDIVQVVGEAKTGSEAVLLAEKLKPDIVLLDIYMPDKNGLQAARDIKAHSPEVNIVMLTSSEDDDHLTEAVDIGVSGYLLKNLDAEELFDLLDGIRQGEAAITRSMASRLFKIFAHSQERDQGCEDLTDREIDVLRLVTRGLSNSDIADELCVSINTVKTHMKNIFNKLGLENRTQVVAYAFKSGIISGEKSLL